MSINLQKGGSFNLVKNEPALKKIMVGLGWELKSGVALDLDCSVFMLGGNGKLPSEQYMVFYNNLKSGDGAVQHTGDNRTGNDADDDEMILVNLPAVGQAAQDLLFVVTIHGAAEKRQNFGLLSEAYIRIVDVETQREVLRYDLDAQFSQFTEVEFGKLHRADGGWSFTASGIGSNHGLQGFVDKYA